MSAPRCRICLRSNVAEINAALLAGAGERTVAKQFGHSKSAVHQHRARHIPEPAAVPTAAAGTEGLQEIRGELRRLATRSEVKGDFRGSVAALESLGRIDAEIAKVEALRPAARPGLTDKRADELTRLIVSEGARNPEFRSAVLKKCGPRDLWVALKPRLTEQPDLRREVLAAATEVEARSVPKFAGPPPPPEPAPTLEEPPSSADPPDMTAEPEADSASVLAFKPTPEALVRDLMVFRRAIPWRRLRAGALVEVEQLLLARLKSDNEADRLAAWGELTRIRDERDRQPQ
jgi:hypothetical protein